MKITLISPSKIHLSEIAQVLQGPTSHALQGGAHEIVPIEGGRSRLAEAVRTHAPDLVLLDGMGRDPDELLPVEQVTAEYPGLAVLMLCAQPSPEFLLRAMRAGVREVLPSPPAPSTLMMAVDRVELRRQAAGRPRRGRLLAFMACKGGSGASFLASNLAYQLAQDASVLLIDLNLQFGDSLSLLREAPAQLHLADAARESERLDASFLSACATRIHERLSVLAASEELADSMAVRPEQIEAIVRLAQRHHDYVIVDLERQLNPLTLRALDLADQIFAVMQANLPALRHARRLQKLFESLSYPAEKTGWIVNRYERSSELELQDIERTLGLTDLRVVANAYREVSAAVSGSAPVMELARSSAVTRHLSDLARSLSPRAPVKRGLIGRLFHRA